MRLEIRFIFYSSSKSVQGNVYPIISTNPTCVVQIKFIFRYCQQLISNSIQLNLQFSRAKYTFDRPSPGRSVILVRLVHEFLNMSKINRSVQGNLDNDRKIRIIAKDPISKDPRMNYYR